MTNLTDPIQIPADGSYVADNEKIIAAPGYSHDVLVEMAGNTRLSGVLLDGSGMTAATAWSSGRPKSAALYAAGTAAQPLDGVEIDVRARQFKNGAVFLSFCDNVSVRRFEAYDVQTQSGLAQYLSGLEVYEARNAVTGDLKVIGFSAKGVSFGNCTRLAIGNVETAGGVAGQASLYFRSCNDVTVGNVLHDGQAARGHGPKLWNTRQFACGAVVARNASTAMQVYGGHARIRSITSRDHSHRALEVDAYFARTDNANNVVKLSETDVVVEGGIASVRAPTDDYDAVGVYIRPDDPSVYAGGAPVNGLCPVRRVELHGTTLIRGGRFGVWSPPNLTGPVETLYIERLDVDDLDQSGYVLGTGFKNVAIGELIVGENAFRGIRGWTTEANRGGTFHVGRLTVKKANAGWAGEPLVRLGHPTEQYFDECGYEAIQIDEIHADANGAPGFKLIDIHAAAVNVLKRITLGRILVRNVPANSEQVRIVLHESASVQLVMSTETRITDVNGNPAKIHISPSAAVTGGRVPFGMSAVFTPGSRPPACTPYYVSHRQNIPSLVHGNATTVIAPVPNAGPGDTITAVPRTPKIGVETVIHWSPGQVAFTIRNYTGSALSGDHDFDVYVDRPVTV